ncbi:MAG: ABC transporter permease [Alphaproteobacteria bacterium]|nr:ABC transporter permease [Alphaproteobacteria bacterium]
MSTLLAMAWRNVFRNVRRSLLTATAMALAVAIVMGIGALQHGMFDQMRDLMIGEKLGHVQVQHPDYPVGRRLHDTVPEAGAVVEALEREPGVARVASRLFGSALLGTERKTEGVQLHGVDPVREDALRDISEKLTAGSWLGEAGAHGIVLGDELARKLEVQVGGELVAVTQAADGSMGNELYTVVGIVDTGSPSVDRAGAFLHRADLGELLVLPDQVHEIVVVARDHSDAALAVALEATQGAVGDREATVRSWKEVDPSTAQIFDFQAISQWILMFFFYGVSGVGVVNTLLMSVLERTREFGVMRAIGLRPTGVVALVVLEAVVLGTFAVLGGAVLGGLFDLYLVQVGVDFSVHGEGFAFGDLTMDPVVHAHVTPTNVWQPIAGIFGFSVLAAIWPAVRAARIQTIDALREA